MSREILDIQGLKTYFFTSTGVIKAVDGMNLKVGEKEAVGLVGESGCGKSTAAFSILKLVPSPPGRIVEGKILFRESDLVKLTEERLRRVRGKEISMIFQHPLSYLNPLMKAGDQIAEALKLHQNLDKKEAKKRAVEALMRVGVPEPSRIVEYYPFQLSGGMRQRVLIATALSCNPSILIADEPTSALDVTVQAQVLNEIRVLIEDHGTSLLLITHDLGIVADICDRVYVMYAGKVVEHASVFAIYDDPKHPYTEGLMRSVLSIDKYEDKFHTIEGVVPDMLRPPLGCRFNPRCPQAKAICRREDPPPVDIERGRSVSCWLYS